MQYDGNKYYEAESMVSDALNALSIANIYSLRKTYFKEGYEFITEACDILASVDALNKKVENIKIEIADMASLLMEKDSYFRDLYASSMTADLFFDELTEGDISFNDFNDDIIYRAMLELEKSGVNIDDMKAEYIQYKYPDIPKDDKVMVDVLFKCPHLVYVCNRDGDYGELYMFYDPNSSRGNEELTDPLGVPVNARTIRFQKNLKTEVDISKIIYTIESMPESLSNENDILTFAMCAKNDSPYDRAMILGNAGSRDVNIFVGHNINTEVLVGTLYHEFAHNYDRKLNKNPIYEISNSNEWAEAVDEDSYYAFKSTENHLANFDGTRLVTDYARDCYDDYKTDGIMDKLYVEDFAESVQLLYELGGDSFAYQFPARAEILKGLFPEMFYKN